MKIFKIVLVLCVLNTFIIAQEEEPMTKEEAPVQAEATVAEEPVPAVNLANEKMSQDIKSFYTAEKEAALYYLGAGALTTTMGLYYRSLADGYTPSPIGKRSDFAYNTGLSYPLIGVGLFQFTTGAFMYATSDKKAKDLEKELSENPESFKDQELKRMENITYWNKMYTYAEYAMIGGGLVAMRAGDLSDSRYMKGLGTGLFIQGIISYALDYFPNKRAGEYKEKLLDFNFSYIPAVKNQGTYAANSQGINSNNINETYYMFTFTYRLK